jgi:hypothetical protein
MKTSRWLGKGGNGKSTRQHGGACALICHSEKVCTPFEQNPTKYNCQIIFRTYFFVHFEEMLFSYQML